MEVVSNFVLSISIMQEQDLQLAGPVQESEESNQEQQSSVVMKKPKTPYFMFSAEMLEKD